MTSFSSVYFIAYQISVIGNLSLNCQLYTLTNLLLPMYKLTFLPNSEYRHTIFSMQISSSFSTIDTDIEIDWHTLPSTPTLLRLVSPPSACLLPSRIQIAHEGHLLWIPFFLWKKKKKKKSRSKFWKHNSQLKPINGILVTELTKCCQRIGV